MMRLIHKDKIRVDNYITVFIIFSFAGFLLFYRLESLMLLLVYPLVALFFYGIIKIIKAFDKKNRGNDRNINKVLLGVLSIIFSLFMLYYLLKHPNFTLQKIINLTAFPLTIVGFAAIFKGTLFKIYSIKCCIINIIIGFMTLIACMLALFSPVSNLQKFFLIHTISLSITILVNILGRAALYLSEYGLSLLHIKNFKLFFYIISDYFVFVNHEGNLILEKM
ncbi:MAG: DUF308 domain-containing protein [Candidatus Thorarchaeota archaeon]